MNPGYFWEDLRRRNRIRYLNGIDKTSGCTSTSFHPVDAPTAYNMEYLQQVAMAKNLGNEVPKTTDGGRLTNVSTSGQALTLLRQRNKIKKDFSRMQAEKEQVVEVMLISPFHFEFYRCFFK